MDRYEIKQGDALAVLRGMPSESVHCVVTSPPYFGLRDYSAPGQMGLEATPEAYLERMVRVFAEVRRVLRRDGTCFVNMGDSYAQDGKWGGASGGLNDHSTAGGYSAIRKRKPTTGLKPKDLVMMPARLALALQADGWWLRSEIVWHKPNPMPESVTDRPTKSHEMIYLLTRSERYYYDAQAIAEKQEAPHKIRRFSREGATQARALHNGLSGNEGSGALWEDTGQRNRRSVWTIPTESYEGAHFATFPTKLVEPCILAGTSERGCCAECGAPWRRVVERGELIASHERGKHDYALAKQDETGMDRATGLARSGVMPGRSYEQTTTGWTPTCKCPPAPLTEAVVLDPFCGSGTTLLVALRHGRRAVGIELNPEYIEMAHKRIAGDERAMQQHMDLEAI